MKTLRIWFGCSLGLGLSMLFDWSYGFFAVISPLFILSKLDRFHLLALLMVPISAISSSLQATFLVELLQQYPLLLTVAVGIMMLFNCVLMAHSTTFLFGFISLFVSSIVFSFASYDFFDIEDFNVNLWIITFVNIGVCALAYWLLPNKDADTLEEPPLPQVRTDLEHITQVAIAWVVAMAAFLVFQMADLYDSLSALASVIIILMPMTLAGSLGAAKVRIIGTALGCLAGAAAQLVLGKWFANGWLFWLAVTIAMGIFCHWQTEGMVKSAIGFSAMSALIVPLTTVVVPEQQDAIYSILYRFSSIFVAVTVTILLMWIVHHWLKAVLAHSGIEPAEKASNR